MPAQEKFALTSQPQDAVFFTTAGWTGGMGQPVLEGMSSEVKHFSGCPIFVSEDLSQLLSARLPDSCSGRLYFIVTANIQLVKRTERNGSVPEAPLQAFWQLCVNRLDDAELLLVPGD